MRHKLIFALLVVYGLLVLYVTVTLAAGGSVPGIFVPICTLTGFSFCLLHAVERLGWKKALLLLATRNRPSVKEAGSDRLVIAASMITGYGNVINALTGNLAGPALAGFFTLTPWVLLAWMRTGKNNIQKAN